MVDPDHNMIVPLLLLVLAVVLLVSSFFVGLVIYWRRRRHSEASTGENADHRPDTVSSLGFRHAALKRPGCWLAIKNRNLGAVQQALALHNPKPCSWLDGLSGNGGQRLFISPPVSGWILVLGPALPEPGDDVDACFRFLLDLSRKLGHVQFFSANTILNHHAWAQVESGRVQRAYAWAGRTLWNQGDLTQAENNLGLKCYSYTDASETSA